MRILFICNSHTWGGAEAYVVMLATAFAERGHSAYLAAPDGSELFRIASEKPELTVLPVSIGPKLSRRSALDMAFRWPSYRAALRRQLREWIERFGIEVVHLQFKKEQILASPLAAKMGIAVVWTEHDRLPRPLARLWPARQVYRFASRYARRIICVAEFVKGNMISHGLNPARLTVCYNGIDPAPSVHDATANLRADLGLGPEDPVIATASRLAWTKGIDHFLEAAAEILPEIPTARFLVLGDGPRKAALQEKARRLGVSGSVTFAGHRRDVPAVLGIIDVFACPSLQEGFPFSVLEAMRAARPVVASRTGGVPELLRHEVDGLLVEVGDVAGLAAAITRLLQDRDMCERLGGSGQRRVLQSFGTTTMVDCTESVFVEALSAATSGSRPIGAGQRPEDHSSRRGTS